jgi:hypothetical protein
MELELDDTVWGGTKWRDVEAFLEQDLYEEVSLYTVHHFSLDHRLVIGHMSGLVAGSYSIIHYTVHLNYIISYGSKGVKEYMANRAMKNTIF